MPLTAPVLTAGPADGSSDTDTTPTFSWNAVGGASGYKVSVDGSGGGGGSAPSQIGVIVLENEADTSVAQANAPTLHGLQATYRNFTNYVSDVHPSLPNYCAMSSGSWLGKSSTDNGTVGFAGSSPNIMAQLAAAGKSWKAYEEDVAASNFTQWTAGLWAGKHCPACFYTATKAAGVGAGNGRFDFSGTGGLVADITNHALPDFFYIIPNLRNDGHNDPGATFNHDRIKFSDDWLSGANPDGNSPPFPGITALIAAMRADGVLFVTYDEGHLALQTIYTVCCGQRVTHDTVSTAQSHYSLLYGIQQNFGQNKFTENGQNLNAAYTNLSAPIPIPQTGGGGTGGIDLGTTRTYTSPALALGGHDFQAWAYDGSGDGPHTTVDWSVVSSGGGSDPVIPTVQVIQENPAWTLADKEVGRVDAITYDPANNIVYVGGNFHGTNCVQQKDGTKVNRSYLFAIDWDTQELIASWNPNPNDRVFSIYVSQDGSQVFVGGAFTSIGSSAQTRHNLACLNAATGGNAGTVNTSRLADLAFNGVVHRLKATADGHTLFAAGDFTAPATTGTRLCKLDLTPTAVAIVQTWKPTTNAHVRALCLDPNSNRLVVGGDFTQVNGATKNSLACIRQDGNGETLPFAYQPADRVLDAVTDGTNVYFGTVNDLLVKCDLATGTSQWGGKAEDTDGNVQAVCVNRPNASTVNVVGGMHGDCIGNAVGASSGSYSGGSCGVATGVLRHKVWRQTAGSGALDTKWDPSLTSNAGVLGVWSLESFADQVWMGGDFTSVGGSARQRFAAVGIVSGPPPPPPPPGGDIKQRDGFGFGEGTTSAAVSPPPTYQAGDLLVAQVTAVGAAALVAPAGWAAAVPILADGTALASCVYTKVAATESATTFSCAGATSVTAYVTAWQNAVGVRASAGAKTSSGGAAALTSPALSGVVAKDEVLTFAATSAGPRPYPDVGGVLVGAMDAPTDWSTQTGIAAIETVAGRKLQAAHSMVPWNCKIGQTGDFTGGAKAPAVDFAHNRLTYTSWPRPRVGLLSGEPSWTSVFGSTDPVTVLNAIAAGTHDAIIDDNATAYKAFGHPIIIRLLWEMNGGGLIWGIGKSSQQANYAAAYIAACNRIISRTRAVAQNVLFHWNPQNFQTVSGSNGSRDNMYWGDSTTNLAGTEGYLSPGDTFSSLMTETSSNGSTYTAIYSGYGLASSHGRILGNGEGGNRYQGTADTTAAAARIDSLRTGLPQYPDWRFYMWWNANGSNGNSDITAQPTACKTAFANWLSQSYTQPRLHRSWKPLPQNLVYEDRRTLGTIGTCYGTGQQGAALIHTTQAADGSAAPVSFQAFGYGSHIAIQLALTATDGPPPPPPPPPGDVNDTFTRTTASGWGVSDDGFAWNHIGGTKANATTDGTTGVLTFPAPQLMVEVLDPAVGVDFLDITDYTDTFTFDVDPVGADYNVSLPFRYIDADNHYRMTLKVGVSTVDRLTFVKRVAGVQSDLNTAFSLGTNFFTAGTTYARRIQCDVGGAMRGKVWDTGGAEPGSWTVSVAAPATDPLPNGGIGQRVQVMAGATSTPTFHIDDIALSGTPNNPNPGSPPDAPTFISTPADTTGAVAVWQVQIDPTSTSAESRYQGTGARDFDTGWIGFGYDSSFVGIGTQTMAPTAAPETVTFSVRSSNADGTSPEASDDWNRLVEPPPPPPPDTGVVWWCTSGQAVNEEIAQQEAVVGRVFLGSRMNINFTSPSIGPNDAQYDLGRVYTYRNSNWQTAKPKAPLSWAEVAKGTYDAQYIIPFFNALKADTARWDGSSDVKTFYFSPHHEQTVNNPPSQVGWSPNGFPDGCGTVADFVDQHRHIVDVADAMGVTRFTKTGQPNGGNCDIVFCPLTNMYIQPKPGAGVADFDPDGTAGGTRAAAPPGTTYYAVLGIDWYAHWDYTKNDLNHTQDASLIADAVHNYAVQKNKDWIVPECGIGSDRSVAASEAAKAAYVRSMRTVLKSYGSVSPGVCRGLFYTPEANPAPQEYSFDTSPDVAAAFTEMAQDDYFKAGLIVEPPVIGPPSVTTTSPVSGTTVSGTTVNVVATATEDQGGITTVKMSVNNGAAVSLSPSSVDANGNGTYIGTATLTASASPGTANTIKVTATDNQVPSQSTTAGTVTVFAVSQVVDVTGPTLTITNPSTSSSNVVTGFTPFAPFVVDVDPNTTIQGTVGTHFTVTGIVTDPSGVRSLVVAFGGNHTRTVAADGSFSYTATLAAGPNAFTVTATDNSPARNTTTTTFVITLDTPDVTDTTDPTLAVTNPADDITIAGNAGDVYLVTGVATDASGIASVTVDGFVVSLAGDGSFAAGILLASGANTVTVVATDASGNSNTTTVTRTVTLVSTLGPTVTITQPLDGAVIVADDGYLQQVTGTASATTGITLLTVNGVATAIASDGSYSQIVRLSLGDNQITVVAVDGEVIPKQSQVGVVVRLQAPDVIDVGGISVSADQQRIAEELQDRGVE